MARILVVETIPSLGQSYNSISNDLLCSTLIDTYEKMPQEKPVTTVPQPKFSTKGTGTVVTGTVPIISMSYSSKEITDSSSINSALNISGSFSMELSKASGSLSGIYASSSAKKSSDLKHLIVVWLFLFCYKYSARL